VRDETPVLWDCNEDPPEQLQHENDDAAIEDYLDGLDPLPATVEVHGYARDGLPSAQQRKAWAASLVEQLLEWIDDEHGDPDGGTDYETEPACVDIALEMVDKALEGYVVWRCHKVCTRTVDVQAWVKEHRPGGGAA